MKNLYILLILSFVSNSFAQMPGNTLINSTSRWQINGSFIAQDFQFCNQQLATTLTDLTNYIEGDTLLGGETYYKMYWERVDSNYCLNDTTITWTEYSNGFKNYIREDNNILYAYDINNQIEVILQDYNGIGIGTDLNNDCLVGSIDTLFLSNQAYLKYNCDCNSEFLIQAIGTKRGLFNTLDCGIGIEGDWSNSCYYKNGFIINIGPSEDCLMFEDTTLINSINTDQDNFFVKIFPNPTSDFIEIQNTKSLIEDYTLYNTEGKIVLSKSNLNTSNSNNDLTFLKTGIYIAVFEMKNNKVFSRRIINSE